MNNEQKKTLLITGASSDIGIKLIDNLVNSYDCVIAHYNHAKDRINDLQQRYGDKILPVKADFMDSESVADFVMQLDELEKAPDHILHLAALPIQSQKFHKFEWSFYKQEIEVSLHSIVEILKVCLPKMARKKYGRIVFLLTSYTLNYPSKYQSPYVAIKYALLGLMKSLSIEYANKGITVNGISPDMIETRFLKQVPDLVVEQNAKNSPLGRNLIVDDVLSTFKFLLSDGSNAVTGQNIGVTGGM